MQQGTTISKREVQYLFTGTMFLVLANIINLLLQNPYWRIQTLIHLDNDHNLAAWYSSIMLAAAGLIAYECWRCASRNNVQGGFSFLLFSGFLFLMSADEIAQLHETFGGRAAQLLNISSQDFAKHTDWVWVGGPFVIVLFIAFILLLKKLFLAVPGSMFYLIIGFCSIILGGVVLESTVNFLNHEELQWIWVIEIILEESLEMIGTVSIAYALVLWRDGIAGQLDSASLAE